MLGEDRLSGRFDYLFEPLDAEESDDAVDAPASRSALDTPTPRSAAPVRLAFAAFVLATIGFAAVLAALLLQRPNDRIDQIEVPLQPDPLSTTVPVMPGQAVPVAPPAAAPTPSEAPPTTDSDALPQTVSQQRPEATSTREPEGAVDDSPTTRAPISVAPQIRAPFPGQGTQGGGRSRDGGGGILGGLL